MDRKSRPHLFAAVLRHEPNIFSLGYPSIRQSNTQRHDLPDRTHTHAALQKHGRSSINYDVQLAISMTNLISVAHHG